MFKKLFSKRSQAVEIFAPLTGRILPLEEVPDEVFSQKMVGDGLAIEPTEGSVAAPFDGDVIQIFPTFHAVGLRNKDGLEVLIHIGLETVGMKGEGFTGHVKQGDQVKKGDKLISFDLEKVKEKADSSISPVIITNGDKVAEMSPANEENAQAGETVLLKVHLK